MTTDQVKLTLSDRVALALESLLWSLAPGDSKRQVVPGIDRWRSVEEARAALADYFDNRLPADPSSQMAAKDRIRLMVEEYRLEMRAEVLANWAARIQREDKEANRGRTNH